MSDGGKIPRPALPKAVKSAAPASGGQYLPQSDQERDPMWPVRDPMRLVRQEKTEAAAQIQRKLKAWSELDQKREDPAPAKLPPAGGALPGELRAKMEPQLGADLSKVKLSTSGESARAAEALGARAFTVGQEVHFGAGQLAPGTKDGDRLLAHELTHTVQAQRSGIARKPESGAEPEPGMGPEVSQPEEPAEKEADAVSDEIAERLHEPEPNASAPAEGAPAPTGDPKPTSASAPTTAAAPPIAAKLKTTSAASPPPIFRAKKGAATAAKPAPTPAKSAAPAPRPAAAPRPASAAPAPAPASAHAPAAKTSPAPAAASAVPAVAPAPAAPAHPQAKEIEAEADRLKPVATLDAYNAMVQSLRLLVTPKSKASVSLRITKLKDAIARTKPKLKAIYKDKADDLIHQWIDSRMPAADAKPGPQLVPAAQQAKARQLAAPTADPNLGADAAGPLVNYGICAPEEAASDKMIDESGGIMKVFDVNGLWRAMDKGCQEIWASTFGGNGNEEFVQACMKAKKLVIAPPGKENAPKFKGKSIEQVFSGPLFGFVGQGKDATKVASFGEAIDRFALKRDDYPSKAMFVVSASAADVKDKKNKGEIKIGKPSIFNLLNFDENVYKEDDREYGHLADPGDATKAGNALELTVQGYPSEIYASARFLG